MFRPTRWLTGLLATLLALTCLSACGSADEGSGGSGEVLDTITITIADGEVEPNGRRITVAKDEPFVIRFDSDVAGELHIHAKPAEMTVAFEAGTSEHTITFDAPGIFPAESHDLNKVIVQFEVR